MQTIAQTVSKKILGLKSGSNEKVVDTKEGQTKPPEWEEDQNCEDCSCCLVKFTVTRRKHHCRKCGRVVCGVCSSYRAAIPEMGFLQPVRICVECNCAATALARGINLHTVAEYIVSETSPKVSLSSQERSSNVQLDQARQDLVSLKTAVREHELKLETAHREDRSIDMTEYSKEMNALVFRIASTTETLRTARSNLGQVVTGVMATEHAEFSDPRFRRFLVITPGPDVIIAVSGLTASKNRNGTFKGGIRFMAVHTLDEVLKVRRCKIQVLGAKGQVSRLLPAMHILWDSPPPMDDDSSSSKSAVGGLAGGAASSNAVAKPTMQTNSMEFYITADISEQSRRGGDGKKPGGATDDDQGKNLYDALQAARRKHFDRVTAQKKRFDHLSRLKEKAVSWTDPMEATMLQDLWKAVRPTDPFPGQKSDKWKDLGFQGADPVTDFRGMGSLSLHCMLYWARNYSDYSIELIAQQHHRAYPICTAAINVCSLVADLTGLNSRSPTLTPIFRVFCRTAEEENTSYFEQLVSVCLALTDYAFVKTQAGYMDFPKVVASVRDLVAAAGAANPVNFSELMGILHEGFLPSPESQETIAVKPAWPCFYTRHSIATPKSCDRQESNTELTKSLYSSMNSDEDSKSEPSRSATDLSPSNSFLSPVEEGVLQSEGTASKSRIESTREQRVSVYFDPITPTSNGRSRSNMFVVDEFEDLDR